MKLTVFVLLFWTCSGAFAQTPNPVIDSISETLTPTVMGQTLGLNAVFNIFINDTSGVQSVTIQIGSQAGASDLFQQNYPASQFQVLRDSVSGYLFFPVNAGNFILSPPFVQTWLVFQDGSTSAILQRQFVF